MGNGHYWKSLREVKYADSEILPSFSHVEPKFKIVCASVCVCLCEGERVTELEVKNKVIDYSIKGKQKSQVEWGERWKMGREGNRQRQSIIT